MAVLDALPGVEVSVSASGKELTEYEERKEEDEPLAVKTVLRYIESISGSEFMINLKISPPFRFDYPQIGFRVFVDGKYIAGKGCSSHRLVAGHWNSSVLGIDTLLPDGSTGIRKFIFNSIKTTDDADSLRIKNDIDKVSEIGQIKIGVFRKGKSKKAKMRTLRTIEEDSMAEIAEKALKGKALSHNTGFLPPTPSQRAGWVKSDYIDGRDKPIGVFIFRYLSKEALQQMLIIPRTPTPDPFDALTNAEKNRLARQMLTQLEASKVKVELKSEKRIKQERDEDSPSNVSARPFKKVKMLDGNEAIDLTD